MLIDSRRLTGQPTLNCDVCIVGAGAAGITIARELIGAGRNVILLESGGLEHDPATQALYEGEATGNVFEAPESYLQGSRLRYFGGTTNHWAGYCRPLEDRDFEEREWVANSGWPLTADELKVFYRRALPILNLPTFDYDIDTEFAPSRGPLAWAPNSEITTAMIHFSPPTRFGKAYREELEKAEEIRVLLYGNAVDFTTSPDSGRVIRLNVRCLSGSAFSIESKAYVLATGGIENARMLLLSRSQQPRGLGNQNDLVGRYFMEHLAMSAGEILGTIPPSLLRLYEKKLDPKRGHESLGLFATTAIAQQTRGLLAFSARLVPSGRRKLTRERRDFLGAMMRFDHLSEPPGPKTGVAYLELLVVAEQAPNPASRVTLSDDLDALGLNKVHLDWRVESADYRSIYDSIHLLGIEFGRASKGRVRLGIRYDEDALHPHNDGGKHHIGTTRMHASPSRGVVDRNCRVHGVPNLFVAGSSVFPTGGGEGTTTLTIVALALRLADRLKKELTS